MKRVFLVLVAVMVMAMATSMVAHAADSELTEKEGQIEIVFENPEDVPGDDGSAVPYGYSTIDLVNEGGVTNGNWSKDFYAVTLYSNCVRLIINLRYVDNHTGNVTVKIGPYTYNVPVDSTTRILSDYMTLGMGNQTVSITGVESQMRYMVHVTAGYYD